MADIFCHTALFFVLCCICVRAESNNVEIPNNIRDNFVQETSHFGKCRSCQNYQWLEQLLTDYEMRNLRIETHKQAILKSLGMTEIPKVNMPLDDLPLPMKEANLIQPNGGNDELISGTSNGDKTIILASDTSCEVRNDIFDLNMTIQVPNNLYETNFRSATIWLYTENVVLNSCRLKTKLCKTIEDGSKATNNEKITFSNGWSQMNLSWNLTEMSLLDDHCSDILLTCKNDNNLDDICRKATKEPSTKPFILVDLKHQRSENRNKRNINCTRGATECCREDLFISFQDIGWNDWIIQPDGYHAYYCKGSCESTASISLNVTPYQSVLRKLYMQLVGNSTQIEFVPCCSPRELSAVQLLYLDHNKNIHHKTIPNLAVESCGCM